MVDFQEAVNILHAKEEIETVEAGHECSDYFEFIVYTTSKNYIRYRVDKNTGKAYRKQ